MGVLRIPGGYIAIGRWVIAARGSGRRRCRRFQRRIPERQRIELSGDALAQVLRRLYLSQEKS